MDKVSEGQQRYAHNMFQINIKYLDIDVKTEKNKPLSPNPLNKLSTTTVNF